MRTLVTSAAVAILITGGAVTIAAPQQYPGQMTQGRVWVQNRGWNEAIPVDLRESNLDRPLRVELMNAGTPSSASNPIWTRPVRPTWEYRTIVLKSEDDAAQALSPSGNEGWEATGIAWPTTAGTRILLKRQH